MYKRKSHDDPSTSNHVREILPVSTSTTIILFPSACLGYGNIALGHRGLTSHLNYQRNSSERGGVQEVN